MIGFVVPNQKHFLALADQFGIRGSMEELCNSKAMEELVLKTITEAALAGETSSKSWNQSSTSRFCFVLELLGTQLVHFSCRLLLSQPSWSASRSRARSVWARIHGLPRQDWWRTPSSSNARSLRHITRRTSRGCTVENDEDRFQSTDQPLETEYSLKASDCAPAVAPLIKQNVSSSFEERPKNVWETRLNALWRYVFLPFAQLYDFCVSF